jgi:hypothetical protein
MACRKIQPDTFLGDRLGENLRRRLGTVFGLPGGGTEKRVRLCFRRRGCRLRSGRISKPDPLFEDLLAGAEKADGALVGGAVEGIPAVVAADAAIALQVEAEGVRSRGGGNKAGEASPGAGFRQSSKRRVVFQDAQARAARGALKEPLVQLGEAAGRLVEINGPAAARAVHVHVPAFPTIGFVPDQDVARMIVGMEKTHIVGLSQQLPHRSTQRR